MPYTPKKNDPLSAMRRLLKGYGFTSQNLAAVLGCHPNTALSRLQRPETLTLGEILAISRRGHVPLDELRAAIREER